ncbi:MAG: diacylglycerol kinase family protein [Candidatus Pseudobacter hemicellulosilyticus]|uniref:Diacylglycerol kinase family protein n=1 Tax=Candidatus Pseudobacter hemicellulosilyticus TaxID=3121375 RepID=A0AAJ6BH93_9BACT|nr:MAG: diacylglycerol kinase family protein [Pseudobacter sp.]
MKLTRLIHNPGAGEEAYDKKQLIALLEAQGFECRYSSTKKDDWEEALAPDVDFVVAAGGDGTIGKVAKAIFEKQLHQRLPIAVLPLGTANNIANALHVQGSTEEIIRSWHTARIKYFDVGKVEAISGATHFLEGFGWGIFPNLMLAMKKMKIDAETPEEELKIALATIHSIVEAYDPSECRLEIDGVDHSGDYLLMEIMNIRSVGPNLNLAPKADPGDGKFDVVLIPESDREKLAQYVLHKINDLELPFPFRTIPATQVRLKWKGIHLHIDDELIKPDKAANVQIDLLPQKLQFLVTEPATGL